MNKWGSEKASNVHDKLSGLAAGLKNKIGQLGLTDLSDIANKLGGASGPTGGKAGSGGTGSKGSGSGFPNVSDPAYSVADSYKMPSNKDLLAGVNDIADNTGSMADSMELSEEDLSYLRDVANMEWKKEFTTAEIHVEMNNNNTVNGDSDLDGLVTKLSEKLYEELDAVANGVYA